MYSASAYILKTNQVYISFIELHLHCISNLHPSSNASDGTAWLYALHDKYLPASERLNVVDNVLVVWLPSLDVCKKNKNILIKNKFTSTVFGDYNLNSVEVQLTQQLIYDKINFLIKYTMELF